MSRKIWTEVRNAPDYEVRLGFRDVCGSKRKVLNVRHKPTGTEAWTFPDTACGRHVAQGAPGALAYVFGHEFADEYIWEKEEPE
jgi:hypothetical protein